MKNQDRLLLTEFRERLSPVIKRRLKKLIVFGSRARGEATEDSDLDVIALVDKKTARIEKDLEDIVYQVMWDHDFKPMISLKVFSEAEFFGAVNKGFSFYRNVEKEGIAV